MQIIHFDKNNTLLQNLGPFVLIILAVEATVDGRVRVLSSITEIGQGSKTIFAQIAAEALGVPTTRYKVSAFVVAAFFAGVAGGLFSHYTYLHTNTFTFMKSIEVIVMVVLGGMGSLIGSVLGATILTALPEVLRFASADRLIIYSLLLVILMIARPQGILGSREIDWGRFIGRGRRPRPEKAS